MEKFKLIAKYFKKDLEAVKKNPKDFLMSYNDAAKLMDLYHHEMMKDYDGLVSNGIYIPLKSKDKWEIVKN
jgi:hypothetical protein